MKLPTGRAERHELPEGFACGVGLDDGSIAENFVSVEELSPDGSGACQVIAESWFEKPARAVSNAA